MRVRLPYIHEFHDRHGILRRYFRRAGWKTVALPGRPGSPEFRAAYDAALGGHVLPPRQPGHDRLIPGTVNAAIAAYYGHGSFRALGQTTRQNRRAILERFRSEHGEKPIATMRQEHVARLLSERKPFAARNWLKALRGLMQFAVVAGLRPDDPTAGIRPMKVRAGTIHTWSEDEIAQFEARHPLGSRARLAMALLLYTAARKGDAVQLGPQHVRNGVLIYRQQKTGRRLAIPLHAALAEVLSVAPSGHLTFLVTAYGAPFTAAGFGLRFRRWCDEAGLPQCSAHGLRKAQARRLAEAGCSAHMIAAVTGHKTLAEVQRYADAADQAQLARDAIERVSNRTPAEPRLATRRPGTGNP